MPPKLKYQFEASEEEKKIKMVRINDSCKNEDFDMYLSCWDGQEMVYTINGEVAILEHLDDYDRLDR